VGQDLPAPLRRALRSLVFYGAVIPVLAQYPLRQLLRAQGLESRPQEQLDEEMHEWGSRRLSAAIKSLRGFYVKTGQILATRVDLFPRQYTQRLVVLQDSLAPLPAEVVRRVVSDELLGGRPLRELFDSFEEEPLGSASIAQVHRARLRDGRDVAVKVLRPGIEAVLRGDIENLKGFAKAFRQVLPVDYYPVFCELEEVLNNELNFFAEAQNTRKVAASVARNPLGGLEEAPLDVPSPVPGMASQSVLVMDYVAGTPLSRLEDEARRRGIKLEGVRRRVLGERIVRSLTCAFGRMVFSSGFVHGDPHPGNLILQPGGRLALIDCGQVKQLYEDQRQLLARAVILCDEYDGSPAAINDLAEVVRDFGVTFLEGTEDKAAAAASVALFLFGHPDVEFPGGFSNRELDERSPLRSLACFPQELVLLGRASVIIRGIGARFGVKAGVASSWRPLAEQTCRGEACVLPAWALEGGAAAAGPGGAGWRSLPAKLQGLLSRRSGAPAGGPRSTDPA